MSEPSSIATFMSEDVVSLAQAARDNGVHPGTVLNWTKLGIQTPAGIVRLQTVYLAGRKVTSRQAVKRFLERVHALRSGQADPAGAPAEAVA